MHGKLHTGIDHTAKLCLSRGDCPLLFASTGHGQKIGLHQWDAILGSSACACLCYS
jgi:hypothetical protein